MAESSFGTLLQVGDGGDPENFTTIGQVRDIGGPEYTRDTVESTHHSSPSGFEEHVGTIKRGNEVTFEINLDPSDATHDATNGLKADYESGVERNFQLVRADAGTTTDSFTALVTGVSEAHPVNGKLTANITLKLTGAPTIG